MPRTNCKLVFEDVGFDRTDKTGSIQDRINLAVMPGEVVVFKGYDTDKKNALIDLLLRLESPSSGKIFLGEHLLHEINLNDLYDNIALLPAEPLLLDDKIAGNIAYGAMRCAHEAEITAAARNSDAMPFIREMSGGLQTPIGEKGVEITRRQLQFLAIARALVKNAPLLILDEFPTTQDPDAEILLSALERLMQNRTTLIFSRQIPPLKKIDRIIE
jgi:subfamily B ATP-binding cassette protein MsbA